MLRMTGRRSDFAIAPPWEARPLQSMGGYCNLWSGKSQREAVLITYNCTIQEGVLTDDQRRDLHVSLTQVGAEVLGVAPDDIAVNYEVIPHGFGFRGGELSTTSSVRSRIPDGYSQEKRVEFMARVQDTWIAITGQTAHELVVGAANSSYDPYAS